MTNENGNTILSVTEFCTIVKRIFSSEEMLHNIAVVGEISGFRASGQHSYFSLKDSGAVLPCSCFNYRTKYVPKEGEKVICIGSPDYYVQGGRFSFIVNKIEPQGIGLLFQQIEMLKKKLYEEGLFAPEHKKPIPMFPKNVIVVTSKTGAVIRDICRTIRKQNNIIDIVVKDVKVQGEYAVSEIVSALNAVDKLGYDCCILARGGGSLEDLMPFYDERICRAIYNMKTPIISAIGHETDTTLCDYVADKRCATPTAAGELIAFNVEDYIYDIIEKSKRALNNVKNILNNAENKTKLLATSIGSGMERLYTQNINRLQNADKQMINALSQIQQNNENLLSKNIISLERVLNNMTATQTSREHLIDKSINALDNLNPTRILKSGYFRVYSDTLPIVSVNNVKVGDKITVKGADGKIKASVYDIEKEDIK